MRYLLVCSFLIILPGWAQATVSISEVAWMGSVTSANHEWIELYNDGQAVVVDGWQLTDGMNLQIGLQGTLPANSYSVLERTSDESAPGTAFLLYTGALVNTGTTLRLERADGSLADQLSGGEGWENIGGDNVTKETAQHTSLGWVSAVPTPGQMPPPAEEIVIVSSAAASVAPAGSNTGSKLQVPEQRESVRLILPEVTLELTVDAQTVGYVHQTIPFVSNSSGIGEHLLDSLQYEWNFGDGFTATTKSVEHVFQYPGTYVVTVYAGFGRQAQVARHEITILPVTMSLTLNERGDVQLHNDAAYELDVSGYRVRGTEAFTFPNRSIILPRQTVTIPSGQLGKTAGMVAVYDTASELVAVKLPVATLAASPQLTPPPPQISAWSDSKSSRLANPASTNFSFETKNTPTAVAGEGPVETADQVSVVAQPQLAAVNPTVPESTNRWTLALIGVLVVAVFGVLVSPRRPESAQTKLERI